MKRYYRLLTLIFAFAALPCKADEWIRINQLGYLPQSIKVAVFMSRNKNRRTRIRTGRCFYRKNGTHFYFAQSHRPIRQHEQYLPVGFQ